MHNGKGEEKRKRKTINKRYRKTERKKVTRAKPKMKERIEKT